MGEGFISATNPKNLSRLFVVAAFIFLTGLVLVAARVSFLIGAQRHLSQISPPANGEYLFAPETQPPSLSEYPNLNLFPEGSNVLGNKQVSKSEGQNFKKGEVIVKIKATSPGVKTTPSSLQGLEKTLVKKIAPLLSPKKDQKTSLSSLSEKAVDTADALRAGLELTRLVTLKPGVDTEQALKQIRSLPDVKYAELNYIVTTQMDPDDPYYHSLNSWKQGYDDLWALKPGKLNAKHAWDLSQGAGVVVAVVDTGIDYNHPDIAENVWINPNEIPNNALDDDQNGYIDDVRGWDFVTYDGTSEDNDPIDGHGHGTHVAGTIAAVGNNALGVIGVAPRAKVMALKGLSDQGSGTDADLARAVVYAAENDAKVINSSWGGGGSSQLLIDAFNYAHSLGVVSVAAAGNSNTDVSSFFPANIETVMAVAATTQNDEKTYFSNYGLKVDVAAPGGGYVNESESNGIRNILSTMSDGSLIAQQRPALRVSSGYYRLAGTSMAAPHVTGLAALVAAAYPSATTDEIRARIIATTDPFPLQPPVPLGTGRINAYNALTASPRPFFHIENVRLEEQTGDGDQIPESNEQIRLIIDMKNIWADGSSVTTALSATDSRVSSIPVSSSNFGDILQGETKDNASNPFVFEIATMEPFENVVNFVLRTNADGQTQEISFEVTLGIRKIPAAITPQFQEIFPIINGNKIVWHEERNGNLDIYLYDLATNQEKRITTDSSVQHNPKISGNKIIWTDYRNGNYQLQENADVYLYDLATNQERRITKNSSNQFAGDISGNKIVWEDGRSGGGEVYLYDLDVNQERRITNNRFAGYPQISGDKITYRDYEENRYYYLYDLATNQETQVSNKPVGSEPARISGRWITWSDWPTGNSDIQLYDIKTNQIQTITNDPDRQAFPKISGNRIVWYTFGNNDDVYLYDINTSQTRQVTKHRSRQLFPSISDDKIIWGDYRDGYEEIYITQIPSSDNTNNNPPIFNPIPDQTVKEGALLQFTVSATDPDGDALTYSASGLPTGANFDPSTQTFSWTPGFDQVGSYSVTFSVSDGKLSDSKGISITVSDVPLSITRLNNTPNPFSPNGDGSKDNTQIAAIFNHAASWNLEIKNSVGGVARTFTGKGDTASQTWDGKDDGGNFVPDGSYTYILNGTDAGGSAASKSGTVTVDTVKPILSEVSDGPDPFHPSQNEITTISYTLSEASYVNITIYNSSRKTVRNLLSTKLITTLVNKIAWDGKDNLKVVVSPGIYTYKVSVRDKAGNPADPFPYAGTVEVQ